jgi:hypothetical protein
MTLFGTNYSQIMQLIKFFKIFLILLSISGFCWGQELVEDENWLKGLGTEADYLPTLVYLPDFNKKDLPSAKKRLGIVRQFTAKSEWEGIYYSETVIGDSKLIWNTEGGFFDFYFYHYPRYFDYGTVNDSPSFVVLVSEKPFISTSPKERDAKTKLVKIKVGEKHFLVPEDRLKDFCEKAVRLSTDLNDIFYYRIKEEDFKKEVSGLPVLPAEYKNFLRYPIEARIIKVSRKKIIPNKQTTKEFNFDDIYYPVSLDVGNNKKVKKGMNFFVEELGEWVQVTKVFQTNSFGFIRRDFDENNKEQCWDSEGGNGQIIPCKEIKVGMQSKTKSSL